MILLKSNKLNKAEQIIKIAMLTRHIKNVRDLADRMGAESATIRKNLKDPDSMSIGRLKSIAEVTGLTNDQIGEIVRAANIR